MKSINTQEQTKHDIEINEYGFTISEIEIFLKIAKKIDLTFFIIELLKSAKNNFSEIRTFYFSEERESIKYLALAILSLKQGIFKKEDISGHISRALYSCEYEIWEFEQDYCTHNSDIYFHLEKARKELNLAMHTLESLE